MTTKEIDYVLVNVNSYNKFKGFLSISKKLKGKMYWYALRGAYDSSDNLFSQRFKVRSSFKSQEPERSSMMSQTELDYLSFLPDSFTIYRAMTEVEFDSKKFGVSWTTKKEVAEFFCNTYVRNHSTADQKKVIHELQINKSDVIAFLNERKEFEIIYLGK